MTLHVCPDCDKAGYWDHSTMSITSKARNISNPVQFIMGRDVNKERNRKYIDSKQLRIMKGQKKQEKKNKRTVSDTQKVFLR